MQASRSEILKKVNAHLIHHLEFSDTHEVETISYKKLLSPSRFDILAKYIYAKSYINKYNLTWATEVYREHLLCMSKNKFVEMDLTGKDSFEKYLTSFNKLLDSFSNSGFDSSVGLLPVGSHGVIIDGSHRASACLAFEKNPTVVKFRHEEKSYSADYLRNLGLSEIYLDSMATEYARLAEDSYMVFLFPIAQDKKNQVVDLLKTYGSIVYEKNIHFFNNGPANLTAQLYKGEPWLGERKDGWPGTSRHARDKFVADTPVTVFLFQTDDITKTREVKVKIRDLYDHGNNSIHINDSREETIRLAEQLFNSNSIHLMNYGDLSKQEKVFSLHEVFKKDLQKNNFDKELLCVDSSSILSLYGLREINDYDYLDFQADNKKFSNELIHQHNQELKHYSQDLNELIFNPKYYLYYDGVKYSSLETVLKMKKNRSEIKDLEDIKLANPIQDAPKNIWIPLKGHSNKRRHRLEWKKILKENLPTPVLPLAKKTYAKLKKFKQTIISAPDYIKFGDLNIKYLGYDVFYSAGTSLIERIRNQKIYEPEVTTALIRELQKFEKPTVIDIGSNIGLITLNILKYSDTQKIFAFEPGPHQFQLLSKTIAHNNLSSIVTASNNALSNYNGEATFVIHSSKHASGDGFKDTKRAGKTKHISVKVQKLDDWWIAQQKPHIHFIKIDTEGSELNVLEGAILLLKESKPTLLLEISKLNLAAYPHNEKDIIKFLESNGYKLSTIAGTPLNAGNIDYYLEFFDEFLAHPNRET